MGPGPAFPLPRMSDTQLAHMGFVLIALGVAAALLAVWDHMDKRS